MALVHTLFAVTVVYNVVFVVLCAAQTCILRIGIACLGSCVLQLILLLCASVTCKIQWEYILGHTLSLALLTLSSFVVWCQPSPSRHSTSEEDTPLTPALPSRHSTSEEREEDTPLTPVLLKRGQVWGRIVESLISQVSTNRLVGLARALEYPAAQSIRDLLEKRTLDGYFDGQNWRANTQVLLDHLKETDNDLKVMTDLQRYINTPWGPNDD